MYKAGDIIKTTGLNMNCYEVDIEVEFVQYLDHADENGHDCIIRDEGINVLANSKEL